MGRTVTIATNSAMRFSSESRAQHVTNLRRAGADPSGGAAVASAAMSERSCGPVTAQL